jgi:hypothetical protein
MPCVSLFVVPNARDWIEKQAAKADAAAATAAGDDGPKKRGYTRRCVSWGQLNKMIFLYVHVTTDKEESNRKGKYIYIIYK